MMPPWYVVGKTRRTGRDALREHEQHEIWKISSAGNVV